MEIGDPRDLQTIVVYNNFIREKNKPTCNHMYATLFIRYTNLFVVETRGEREHSGAWIQREHIVRPVGDEDVAQLAVGPLSVGVCRDDLAHAAAPGHVLRDVERISCALEGRRVVIGVGNL